MTYFCTAGIVGDDPPIAAYRFLSTWLLEAPRGRVWDTIYDAERWPKWWRGVERCEVIDDRLWRSAWRSVLPYTLEFEFEILQVDRPNILEGRACGELSGTGSWRVYESALGTASTWEWNVSTTKRWMNVFGPATRATFAWNHHRIMRWGAEGVARELGCRLIAAT
jgi:Polyketide cyclase / dehydrase and lipid transport